MTIVHRTRPRPSYVLINTLDAKSEKIPASQTIVTVEAWPGAVEVLTMILILFTNCRASKTTSLVTIERRDRKHSRAPGPSLTRDRDWGERRSSVPTETLRPQYLQYYNPGPTFQLSSGIKIGTTLYGGPDSYSPDIKRVNQIFQGPWTKLHLAGVWTTFSLILNAVWEFCETNQIKLSNGIWSFSARNFQTWWDVLTVIGCSLLQLFIVIFCSDTIFCFRDYKAILDQ